MKIGKKVILQTLMLEEHFAGEIIEINNFNKTCIVKLEKQESPVCGVQYYDCYPGNIEMTRWQFCYPMVEETNFQ